MKVEVTDWSNNPQLRKLMINYYGITHEMSATDDDLLTEYYWLCRENKLHLLFECEKMSIEFKSWGGGLHNESMYTWA
jgi:hypothetical protein